MAKWPTSSQWPTGTRFPQGSEVPASGQNPPIGSPLEIFQPSAIVEWWRSDLLLVPGATITWTGSFAGTVLSQGAAANQPAVSTSDAAFNGRPSITGDGSNDSLNSSLVVPAPGTEPRYYWFIFKPSSTATPATTNVIFCGKTNFCQEIAQLSTTGNYVSYNGVARSSPEVSPNSTAKRGEALFTNSTSDKFTIGGTTVSGVNTGNTGDASGWGLFSHGGADAFWGGAIAEVLILNRAPFTTELQRLDRYGVSLYGGAILT